MKGKILCITPSEEAVGYLTAGKQYDIESTCADGQCARVIDDQGDEISIFVDQSSHGKFRQILEESIDAAHAEALDIDAEIDLVHWDAAITEERETVRAIIAQAIHAGANSFGHIIGEHEELVQTLHNAGFLQAAVTVDAIIDGIGGSKHKEIRSNWLVGLRQISASI